MRESFYMGKNVVVLDFSNEYYQNTEELVSSNGFKTFIGRYLKDLAIRDIKMFNWITNSRDLDEMVKDTIRLTKQLTVLDIEDIFNPRIDDINIAKALYIVEDAYNYWRAKQRFSVINAGTSNLSFMTFIEADSKYNQLVLELYRTCEEKLQGKSNKIYRQLQAGTNASFVIKKYRWNVPNGYSSLKNILFVNTVMLRTPILFHSESNKRVGTFVQNETNPLIPSVMNQKDWYCYPAKVGGLLCFVYFHKDYCFNGISLANLFELATEEECIGSKPDLICLFGNPDDKESCNFYHDEVNDIWVGSVSADWKVEYFGYIKKAILTLHNLCKMQRNALPIHGSMVNIYFKNGKKKSIVFVGDSGAGKSETIETLRKLSNEQIDNNSIQRLETVFDDMGSLHIKDGKVYANGTETGAFVRLDDLDKLTAYKDMERNIFINPEKTNARVIQPIVSYELTISDHPVDMLLYANNYENKIGIEKFETYQQGKKCFVEGKRMAMQTTQEKGLSSTFFANPFGPMQKQEQCLKIMDEIFDCLYKNNIYIGQIFTNLGTDCKENIVQSAQYLLTVLKND